ncbi:ribosomal protein L24 [Chondrus crispus]|uniref:Ribosomal protein L24 n=1 Tax=Chondrus crispus TaxID=2769 RepID=R7Q3B7_CHOCR|nr:ribosomal protein L24 [Chondrus crispus]CDF32398.1 ribosomal protein L24 [Chondrus crispus]|eukprot:XP_005712063.1 ribosomal protein L24 [Chondrus crispus]
MVVKTDLCFYSGFRIYPGHGRRYIRTDGRQYVFINSKSEASFHMKRKAAKHSWTQLYRRLNKKGIQEETQRRRNRRKVSAAPKAVEGAPLEVIKAKRNQRPEVRKAARDAALKDIKERKKAAKPKTRSQIPSGRGAKKMPVAQRR